MKSPTEPFRSGQIQMETGERTKKTEKTKTRKKKDENTKKIKK